MKLVNIGFGNVVSADKILAVVSPDSSPIKRIIQEAREKGNLIDATYGRKTQSVIITESDHVILSFATVETISGRLEEEEDE